MGKASTAKKSRAKVEEKPQEQQVLKCQRIGCGAVFLALTASTTVSEIALASIMHSTAHIADDMNFMRRAAELELMTSLREGASAAVTSVPSGQPAADMV